MKKCPHCAEEIQDDAVKCKHCGEFLNKTISRTQIKQEDNSQKIKYSCVVVDKNGEEIKCFSYGENEEAVKNRVESKGYKFVSIVSKVPPYDKFSCPRCGSRYTACERAMGCLFMLAIFVSLGLALFAIPFLPHNCKCEMCGYSWRT